jgi:galactokinase/mevalonate kinase-like predicted kinase
MNYRDRKIVSSAPGRAGIVGNPTDIYGGCVISCSVGMRATVVITPHPTLSLITANEELIIAKPEDLALRGDRYDIVRAVISHFNLLDECCRIEYDSAIPSNSGLAGSTALMVALVQGLLTRQDLLPHPYLLAETARYIELHGLKITCGYQDAYMTTFGGLNFMDFRGKLSNRPLDEELHASIEPLAPHLKNADELPFLLARTPVKRVSGAVHKPLRERWLAGEPSVVQGYQRIAELAQLGKKALLNADWPQLGALMNENHEIQRNLGGSGESNERLIAAALSAGALGAKLAGAGEGGTIIALWPHKDFSPLETALHEAGAAALYRPVIDVGAVVGVE